MSRIKRLLFEESDQARQKLFTRTIKFSDLDPEQSIEIMYFDENLFLLAEENNILDFKGNLRSINIKIFI